MEYIAKAAQIFRILRILRIFKLSRHITGLKTLGYTLRNSQRELLLLTMTVSMCMLICAGMAYALEKVFTTLQIDKIDHFPFLG